MDRTQLVKRWKYKRGAVTLGEFPAVGAIAAMLLGLTACSSATSSLERASSEALAFHGWQHMPLPGKATTDYQPARYGERDVLQVFAESSASLMRRKLLLEPQHLGQIHFSWKVPALMPASDMARREAEDSVVRVVLSFDGDRSRLSARDHMLSELAQLMTGEPMPYATLMYVWCPTREAGSTITNPRTDRIRKLVVESGEVRLNQWLEYERDIRADFRAVFGEEPGRLTSVAIMTDSDNTGSSVRAWYGPVRLEPARVANSD